MSAFISKWTIDFHGRRVTHSSGASATFHRYEKEEDWLRSDAVGCENAHLYPGSTIEFAELAKKFALDAGMKAN